MGPADLTAYGQYLNDLARLLAHCPRCGASVLLTCGRFSTRVWALFDAVPWSPLDEELPEGMTAAAESKWRRELPYRLAIAYVDFTRGTWEPAQIKPTERMRTAPLFRPHVCEEDRLWLEKLANAPSIQHDLDEAKARLAASRDVVVGDEGAGAGAVANGHGRRRHPRPRRARADGV